MGPRGIAPVSPGSHVFSGAVFSRASSSCERLTGPLPSFPLLCSPPSLLDATETLSDLALDALEAVVDGRVKGFLDGIVQDIDDLRTEGREKVLERGGYA